LLEVAALLEASADCIDEGRGHELVGRLLPALFLTLEAVHEQLAHAEARCEAHGELAGLEDLRVAPYGDVETRHASRVAAEDDVICAFDGNDAGHGASLDVVANVLQGVDGEVECVDLLHQLALAALRLEEAADLLREFFAQGD